MRWPRPRFTVRRAMLVVLVVAWSFGVILPAIEVGRDRNRDFHVHTWFDPHGGVVVPPIPPDTLPMKLSGVEMRSTPFWPRYWRCLLGRPWRGQPLCDLDSTRMAEACEHAYPGMVKRRPDQSFDIDWSPRILARMRTFVPNVTLPNPSPPPSPK
jgi:hypothetical protein